MQKYHYQKTIKKMISLSGIGVHSGLPATITCYPASGNTGIRFYHTKHNNHPLIIGTIIPEQAQHATVIKNAHWNLSTIEHLLAALAGVGIDNIDIVINGNEIPIFDGSAAPFVYAFYQSGTMVQAYKKKYIRPKEPIIIQDTQGRLLSVAPIDLEALHKPLSINYTADFFHPAFASQQFSCTLSEKEFTQSVAPARTFGFLEQLPFLRQKNLAHGSSLGNTVVLSGENILTKMRYENECIRHKVLDLFGDITLLGLPLKAKIEARKTSHDFNRALIENYLTQSNNWDIIE